MYLLVHDHGERHAGLLGDHLIEGVPQAVGGDEVGLGVVAAVQVRQDADDLGRISGGGGHHKQFRDSQDEECPETEMSP